MFFKFAVHKTYCADSQDSKGTPGCPCLLTESQPITAYKVSRTTCLGGTALNKKTRPANMASLAHIVLNDKS